MSGITFCTPALIYTSSSTPVMISSIKQQLNNFLLCFMQMFFEDNIDDAKYCGHLYGLGTSFVMNGNSYHDNGDNSSSSWWTGMDEWGCKIVCVVRRGDCTTHFKTREIPIIPTESYILFYVQITVKKWMIVLETDKAICITSEV